MPVLTQNSVFFQKFPIFKNSPIERWSFNTKFRVFQKNSVFSKIPRSRDGVLTQNSVFFKKFPVFKNSPFDKRSFHTKFHVFSKIPHIQKNSPFEKVCTFQKVAFFNKIRFVGINIWVSPILYGTFVILYPSTSKTCKKQAFKRTISMFDINYRDQKVLCIANLIPVGRLRTIFRTF